MKRADFFIIGMSALLSILKGSEAWIVPSARRIVGLSSSSTMGRTLFRHLSVQRMSSTDSSSTTSTADSSSSPATQAVPFQKPERVIREPQLPVVYCYDHCPFCVRVRFALGLKNIKHRLVFLANDDVQTPTKLIGKKLTPIFEWPEADVCMPESMDIVKLIDSDERLGPINAFQPASERTDLAEWQASVRDVLRTLQRPRYVATGLLPEFQQLDGRQAFVRNHPMPPYSKDEWKNDMTDKQKLQVYAEAMEKDPAGDIEEVNRKLVTLDDIIFSEHHCSPTGGISYDDIDLWSRLRSITIVEGVEWPARLRAYMDQLSELADIPLYDQMAQ